MEIKPKIDIAQYSSHLWDCFMEGVMVGEPQLHELPSQHHL